MDKQSAKKFNKQVLKDMRITKPLQPGDLLSKAQTTTKRPTRKTTAVLGLL